MFVDTPDDHLSYRHCQARKMTVEGTQPFLLMNSWSSARQVHSPRRSQGLSTTEEVSPDLTGADLSSLGGDDSDAVAPRTQGGCEKSVW